MPGQLTGRGLEPGAGRDAEAVSKPNYAQSDYVYLSQRQFHVLALTWPRAQKTQLKHSRHTQNVS